MANIQQNLMKVGTGEGLPEELKKRLAQVTKEARIALKGQAGSQIGLNRKQIPKWVTRQLADDRTLDDLMAQTKGSPGSEEIQDEAPSEEKPSEDEEETGRPRDLLERKAEEPGGKSAGETPKKGEEEHLSPQSQSEKGAGEEANVQKMAGKVPGAGSASPGTGPVAGAGSAPAGTTPRLPGAAGVGTGAAGGAGAGATTAASGVGAGGAVGGGALAGAGAGGAAGGAGAAAGAGGAAAAGAATGGLALAGVAAQQAAAKLAQKIQADPAKGAIILYTLALLNDGPDLFSPLIELFTVGLGMAGDFVFDAAVLLAFRYVLRDALRTIPGMNWLLYGSGIAELLPIPVLKPDILPFWTICAYLAIRKIKEQADEQRQVQSGPASQSEQQRKENRLAGAMPAAGAG